MLANMRIGTRLKFVLLLLSVLLVVIAGIGLWSLAGSNAALYKVYQHRTTPVGELSTVTRLILEQRVMVLDSVHANDIDRVRANTALMTANRDEFGHIWSTYMANPLGEQERALAQRFLDARTDLSRTVLEPIMNGLIGGDRELVMSIAEGILGEKFRNLQQLTEEMVALHMQAAEQEYQAAEARYNLVLALTLGALLVGLTTAFFVGRMLVGAIVQPLQQAMRVANAIAQGDFTQQIDLSRKDEIGQLLAAMKDMSTKMDAMVIQIMESAANVATGSHEIAAGNVNLSQRTEEQASSLEETASSIEELTSTVKQNADNAGQANQLASAARDSAEKGGQVVAKAVGAMSEINASSKRVADIVGVIDEIAFQTNLLALNAAVEAARAGEQGRGFAVVAAEVRNLAQRSASSAREIKDLILDSVQKVDGGTALVEESGKTLEEIVGRVKKVTDIVAEIAAASQEQSAGIEQVNKAIMQLDELTQQNAALVEQASAASQSMSEQAATMSSLLSQYKVSRAVSRPAPKTAVPTQSSARQVERRSGNRPWSGQAGASLRPVKKAAGDEWKEF